MKNLIALCAILLLCGCATNKANSSGGYWNDRDINIVCQALISDCISSDNVASEIRAWGNRKPVVIVGRFRNDSSEQLDTAIISSIMETAIFNSGKLNFVAGGSTRDELRAEKQDQLSNASEETAASLGREIGADYMLTGSVRTVVVREGNWTRRTYYVTAELTNIETNERMWMGLNSQITKEYNRPNNRL
jgi:penicillin-binding protein activator